MIKKILKSIGPLSYLLDILSIPLVIIALVWLRVIKFIGVKKFPLNKKFFSIVGILPVVNHYYEPLINPQQLSKPFNAKRNLPGINFKIENQIDLISSFNYQSELLQYPVNRTKNNSTQFYYKNKSFESGDAELYYSMIRKYQPAKIIEIGSGYSTLIAIEAIKRNNNQGSLTCIEPFEMEWLDKIGIDIIREKVELLPLDVFNSLNENDILFVDSSHVIRPQGDVIFEVLEILPILKPGVLVHFHDIFTPNDYPSKWLTEELRLWNEQYLLEAFLSNNAEFEILCSLNLLTKTYPEAVNEAFPVYFKSPNANPGSFWIRKNSYM